MADPTVIVGLTGSLTMPNGVAAKFNALVLTAGQELADISSYGGAGWRERVALLSDIAGQVMGFITQGDAQDPKLDGGGKTPGTMTITFDTGCTVSFNALIGAVQVRGQYAGLNIASWDFAMADGVAPTVAWANGAT